MTLTQKTLDVIKNAPEGSVTQTIMENRQVQRELFAEQPEGCVDKDDIDRFKNLLARATNHAEKNKSLKAIISKTIGDREKYYRKMAAALAEAVRDKSSLPLQQAFTPETWERELEELEPRDVYHDSLRVWMSENQG